TLVPTADTTSGACRLYSPDGSEVNIRSGPATNYALLGRFRAQTELAVIGYNSTWFVVSYNGVQGWVAGWVTERKGNCGSLAFVTAPPLPTALPATAVPTAPPAPAGAVIEFWADSYNIFDDQCTRINWRVENIQAVALDGAGVVGQDSREVCPDVNTTYTLRVTLRDGSPTDRPVTITVTPRTTAQPDLYVSEFSLNPAIPVKGQAVEVRVGVYNQGDAAVPATAFRVEWFPGENYPAAACSWELGSLAAHGGRIVTCTYPGYPSPYGSINTLVKIDVNNTIGESNEGNNRFTQAISVSNP
ncbi:MAG TPA: CARDB domain-containing protein, partial [Phototrophicaceae bacterium]|nr:CARDB domain-containing protein [Phototrophicaceae bacterium]